LKKLDLSDLHQLLDLPDNRSASSQKRILNQEDLASAQYWWTKILPELLTDHSVPSYCKDGVLTVSVDHPIYAQQVLSQQVTILEALKNKNINIKRIKTRQQAYLKFPIKNQLPGNKTEDIMSQSSSLVPEDQNSERYKVIDELIDRFSQLI
jgi:hypothetical protein